MRMSLEGDLRPTFLLRDEFSLRGRLVEVSDDLLDEYGEMMRKWTDFQERLALLPGINTTEVYCGS